MRPSRPLFVAAPALLVLTLFGQHRSERSTTGTHSAVRLLAPPDSEPMVAEALLLRDPDMETQKFFYLPVTIEGRRVSLFLDTGAEFPVLLFTRPLTQVGLKIPTTKSMDSLTMGSITERHVPVVERGLLAFDTMDTPSGLPQLVGIMGNWWLRHYDMLVDGPAGRMRLYKYSHPSMHSSRLPGGLRSADCTPLHLDPDSLVHMNVMIAGHPVSGWFNSGSNGTSINVATAKLLGITEHTPHLKTFPITWRLDRFRRASYEMDDVSIMVGSQSLTLPHVFIYGSFDASASEKPFVHFGTDAFSDRRLLISYSSRQFCLGAPKRATP